MFTSNNKSRLTQGISLVILGIGLASSFSASAEKYYKWVDDAGSTHYTQAPPAKAAAKKSELVDIVVTAPSSTPIAPTGQPQQNQAQTMDNTQQNQPALPDAPRLEYTPPPAGGSLVNPKIDR